LNIQIIVTVEYKKLIGKHYIDIIYIISASVESVFDVHQWLNVT